MPLAVAEPEPERVFRIVAYFLAKTMPIFRQDFAKILAPNTRDLQKTTKLNLDAQA